MMHRLISQNTACNDGQLLNGWLLAEQRLSLRIRNFRDLALEMRLPVDGCEKLVNQSVRAYGTHRSASPAKKATVTNLLVPSTWKAYHWAVVVSALTSGRVSYGSLSDLSRHSNRKFATHLEESLHFIHLVGLHVQKHPQPNRDICRLDL